MVILSIVFKTGTAIYAQVAGWKSNLPSLPLYIPSDHKPPTLVQRISINLHKDALIYALWTIIAYQVTTVVFSLVFRAVVSTLAKSSVLAFLFYAHHLLQKNQKLQEDNTRKNQLLDEVIAAKAERDEQIKTISSSNATLKSQLEQMSDSNTLLKQQLKSLESAAEKLIQGISSIDQSHQLLSSSAQAQQASLETQIEYLTIAGTTFITFVTDHQSAWTSCIQQLQDYDKQIRESTVRYEEKETHLRQIHTTIQQQTFFLEEIGVQLQEKLIQLGLVGNQLNAAASRVEEQTQTAALKKLVGEIIAITRSPNKNSPPATRSLRTDNTTS